MLQQVRFSAGAFTCARNLYQPAVTQLRRLPVIHFTNLQITGSVVPLILTLRLDDTSFRYFNDLRQLHFPPDRNFLKAHLTLFHHLPHLPEMRQDIAAAATAAAAPLHLAVNSIMKLGNGVAFKIESEPLVGLHRRMQQQWQPHLSRQDQQGLRPHITIQNKVSAAEAHGLYQQLAANFSPFAAQGLGFDLFSYLGGPWRWEAFWSFGSAQTGG